MLVLFLALLEGSRAQPCPEFPFIAQSVTPATLSADDAALPKTVAQFVPTLISETSWHSDLQSFSMAQNDNASYTGDLAARISEWEGQQDPGSLTALQTEVLSNNASLLLEGLYSSLGSAVLEVALLDLQGVLVGASNLTDRYSYGDETWFNETVACGMGALYLEAPAPDRSTVRRIAVPVMKTYQTSGDALNGVLTVLIQDVNLKCPFVSEPLLPVLLEQLSQPDSLTAAFTLMGPQYTDRYMKYRLPELQTDSVVFVVENLLPTIQESSLVQACQASQDIHITLAEIQAMDTAWISDPDTMSAPYQVGEAADFLRSLQLTEIIPEIHEMKDAFLLNSRGTVVATTFATPKYDYGQDDLFIDAFNTCEGSYKASAPVSVDGVGSQFVALPIIANAEVVGICVFHVTQASSFVTKESWFTSGVWNEVIFPLFHRSHPAIMPYYRDPGVQNQLYPTYLEYAFIPGEAPDIVALFPFAGIGEELYESDFLQPLNDLPGLNAVNYKDGAKTPFATADGDMWALPTLTVLHGWFYNKDYFARNGLALPQSLAEFETLCETILSNNIQDPSDSIIPIGIGPSETWTLEVLVWDVFGPSLWGGQAGLDRLDSGEATWSDPDFVRVAELIGDYAERGFLGEDYEANTFYGGVLELFAAGEVAMLPAGSWIFQDLFLRDNLDFEVGGFPPLPAEVGEPCHVTAQPDMGMAMNKASPRFNATLELLEWMTTAEFAEALQQEGSGWFSISNHEVPLQSSLAEDWAAFRTTCNSTLRTSTLWPAGENGDEFATLSGSLSKVALLEYTPLQAMQAMEAKGYITHSCTFQGCGDDKAACDAATDECVCDSGFLQPAPWNALPAGDDFECIPTDATKSEQNAYWAITTLTSFVGMVLTAVLVLVYLTSEPMRSRARMSYLAIVIPDLVLATTFFILQLWNNLLGEAVSDGVCKVFGFISYATVIATFFGPVVLGALVLHSISSMARGNLSGARSQVLVPIAILAPWALGFILAAVVNSQEHLGSFRGLYCYVNDWAHFDTGGLTFIFLLIASAATLALFRSIMLVAQTGARKKEHSSILQRGIRLVLSLCFCWFLWCLSGLLNFFGVPPPVWFESMSAMLITLQPLIDFALMYRLTPIRTRITGWLVAGDDSTHSHTTNRVTTKKSVYKASLESPRNVNSSLVRA